MFGLEKGQESMSCECKVLAYKGSDCNHGDWVHIKPFENRAASTYWLKNEGRLYDQDFLSLGGNVGLCYTFAQIHRKRAQSDRRLAMNDWFKNSVIIKASKGRMMITLESGLQLCVKFRKVVFR